MSQIIYMTRKVDVESNFNYADYFYFYNANNNWQARVIVQDFHFFY